MAKVKDIWWRLPSKIRKPIVTIVGSLFILASALTGWLPGPGGIPLLVIGIAILASEFEWAARLRDRIYDILKDIGRWLDRHKAKGINIVMILFSLLTLLVVIYLNQA